MSFLGDIFSGIGDAIGSIFGGGNDDAKAEAARQMAEYQRQQQVLEGQLKAQREQALQQKNRLDEKQVRQLRHSYSSDGLLSGLSTVNPAASNATSNVTGG